MKDQDNSNQELHILSNGDVVNEKGTVVGTALATVEKISNTIDDLERKIKSQAKQIELIEKLKIN